MNALAKRWLAVLRSGKRKQGRRLLRSTDDEFCCLGVLCEVAGMTAQESSYTGGAYTYAHSPYGPPDRLLERVGLTRLDAGVLVDFNDKQRLTFAEIADELEARFAMDAPPKN